MSNTAENLAINPAYYLPELVGALIILWFGWTLMRRKKVKLFLRRGRIE
jgi:hypothetical protein